ncbi:unnamed protein product [Agarophyton chilense]
MSLSVSESADLLGVPLPENDSEYKLFVSTILSELNPISTIIESLPEVALRSVGFEGDSSHNPSVIQFLLSTLQTHRILQHAQSPHEHDANDELLTDAVSRMCVALQIAPLEKRTFTPSDVAAIIGMIESKLDADVPRESRSLKLGAPLLSETLTNSQRAECSRIHSALQREHELRRNMLLTRLDVTLSSFARSKAAKQNWQRFEALKLRIGQLKSTDVVALYEALAARQWLVANPPVANRVDANHVKSFLMGQVPDRGGRVSATGGQMPQFRDRLPSWKDRSSSKGKGRHKGNRNKRKA